MLKVHFLPLYLLLFYSVSSAQTASFPKTRLSGYQINFSGEDKKSFSETGSGVGVEVTTLRQGSWFTPYAKLRYVQVAGDQVFDDGGTDVESDFLYSQGSLDVGTYFYPLERNREGFNLYLGVAASFSYHYINLTDDDLFSTLSSKDQSFSVGYAMSVGAEWILSAQGQRKWSLFGEIGSRTESTRLVKKNQFSVNGFTLSVGIGF